MTEPSLSVTVTRDGAASLVDPRLLVYLCGGTESERREFFAPLAPIAGASMFTQSPLRAFTGYLGVQVRAWVDEDDEHGHGVVYHKIFDLVGGKSTVKITTIPGYVITIRYRNQSGTRAAEAPASEKNHGALIQRDQRAYADAVNKITNGRKYNAYGCMSSSMRRRVHILDSKTNGLKWSPLHYFARRDTVHPTVMKNMLQAAIQLVNYPDGRPYTMADFDGGGGSVAAHMRVAVLSFFLSALAHSMPYLSDYKLDSSSDSGRCMGERYGRMWADQSDDCEGAAALAANTVWGSLLATTFTDKRMLRLQGVAARYDLHVLLCTLRSIGDCAHVTAALVRRPGSAVEDYPTGMLVEGTATLDPFCFGVGDGVMARDPAYAAWVQALLKQPERVPPPSQIIMPDNDGKFTGTKGRPVGGTVTPQSFYGQIHQGFIVSAEWDTPPASYVATTPDGHVGVNFEQFFRGAAGGSYAAIPIRPSLQHWVTAHKWFTFTSRASYKIDMDAYTVAYGAEAGVRQTAALANTRRAWTGTRPGGYTLDAGEKGCTLMVPLSQATPDIIRTLAGNERCIGMAENVITDCNVTLTFQYSMPGACISGASARRDIPAPPTTVTMAATPPIRVSMASTPNHFLLLQQRAREATGLKVTFDHRRCAQAQLDEHLRTAAAPRDPVDETIHTSLSMRNLGGRPRRRGTLTTAARPSMHTSARPASDGSSWSGMWDVNDPVGTIRLIQKLTTGGELDSECAGRVEKHLYFTEWVEHKIAEEPRADKIVLHALKMEGFRAPHEFFEIVKTELERFASCDAVTCQLSTSNKVMLRGVEKDVNAVCDSPYMNSGLDKEKFCQKKTDTTGEVIWQPTDNDEMCEALKNATWENGSTKPPAPGPQYDTPPAKSGFFTKLEHGVESLAHGIEEEGKHVVRDVERGGRRIVRGVERDGRHIVRDVERDGKAIERGIRKGAREFEHGVRRGVRDVERDVRRSAKLILK